MNTHRLLPFLACAVFWAGAEESPQTGDVASDPRLKRFDKNGDGKIDDSERQAIREFVRQRGQKPGSMTPSGKAEVVGNRIITEREYASPDGRKIPCVLSMPEGEGPFPVVVTIHGGQGDRDYAYLRTMAAPNPVSPTVSAINGQQWAVLAISYRNGGMFGMEQDDVVAGIRFGKTLPKIDPDRVGVMGGSHGGHLALRAAELTGAEFRCLVAGSPWMTDPFVYMTGKADEPPLSQIPEAARSQIMANGGRLYNGLRQRAGSEEEARRIMREHSIEANAGKIVVPALFLTSRADEQAPHLLVEPTIEKMRADGREIEVFTVEKSPHGFYWGRDVGGARIGKGEKTEDELAEEKATRGKVIEFFTRQFARGGGDAVAGVKSAASAPEVASPERPTAGTSGPGSAAADARKRPTSQQAAAIQKLRSRMADMPVPENLTRRTLKVGGREREFFINIPESVKGKPSPVVFALHGGASSTGLAEHLKVDFTKLGEAEGYVTVYPSGVNGWNIGSHDMYSVKRRTSDADDVGFFRAMFDTLISEKIADPKRIFITGGSNGGVMTQFLVCSLADRIAGAGVVVATLPRAAEKDWPKPSRPVPILVMLGTVDPMKPWAGNADQMSAEETIAFWRKQNGCEGEAEKRDLPDRDPDDGCRVHAQHWEGKAPVVFYTLEGHGHGWPMQKGRDETGTGPKTRDINAPEEFWKFFKTLKPLLQEKQS